MTKNYFFVAVLAFCFCSCHNGESKQSKEEAMYYMKGVAEHKTYSDKKLCILAAGQSNIDGRVEYSLMPNYLKKAQPLKNTFFVKNDIEGKFASINITDKWAFDLVTYYQIAKATNDDLYVIKWTEGGTSIDPLGDSEHHWTADWERLGGGNPCLNNSKKKFFGTLPAMVMTLKSEHCCGIREKVTGATLEPDVTNAITRISEI